MPLIAPISRDEQYLMQKAIHKTLDKNYARRLTAILMLHQGDHVSDVARTICSPIPLLSTRLTGSRWRTEQLALKINEITGSQIHAGTVRRWLPSAGLSGEGLLKLCVSVTHIKMNRWQQSIKHWTNAAQSIPSFMKIRISLTLRHSRKNNRIKNMRLFTLPLP